MDYCPQNIKYQGVKNHFGDPFTRTTRNELQPARNQLGNSENSE